MAKTRNQHEKDILKVIQEKKIFRISHIFSHYPDITRATFYNWNFDKLDSISNALLQNREKAKEYMLQKWVSSNNPTLQIAAFRLLADKEEHMLLNQQYIEQNHTSSDGSMTPKVNISPIEWTKTTDAKDK